MQRVATALLIVLFTGCMASGTAIQTTREVVKDYEIGQTYERNTGSAIVEGGRIYTAPAFRPVKSFQPPTPGLLEGDIAAIDESQLWKARSKRDDGGFFLDTPPSYTDRLLKLAINADGSIADGGWYNTEIGGNEPDKGEWPKGKVFERAESVPLEGSFEFEILYSGTSGETVNMTYREYIDGMQRADYSQDLSYNIAEQDTISFRSIRMHVKEANSSSIRFEVLEDGGLPWLPQ
jgi:hypothetical protein